MSLGLRSLGKLLLAIAMAGIWVQGPVASADSSTMEVFSSAVDIDVPVSRQADRLVPSDFVEQLSVGEPEPINDGLRIAEPGTLGLMALAGLMGGAIAMRRRLG